MIRNNVFGDRELCEQVWESLLTSYAVCSVRGGQQYEQFLPVIIN